MLNFNLSERGLGLVSASYFVHDFSRKMFLMSHYINWPNFIVWLPLLLKLFDNMCITIVNQAVASTSFFVSSRFATSTLNRVGGVGAWVARVKFWRGWHG